MRLVCLLGAVALAPGCAGDNPLWNPIDTAEDGGAGDDDGQDGGQDGGDESSESTGSDDSLMVQCEGIAYAVAGGGLMFIVDFRVPSVNFVGTLTGGGPKAMATDPETGVVYYFLEQGTDAARYNEMWFWDPFEDVGYLVGEVPAFPMHDAIGAAGFDATRTIRTWSRGWHYTMSFQATRDEVDATDPLWVQPIAGGQAADLVPIREDLVFAIDEQGNWYEFDPDQEDAPPEAQPFGGDTPAAPPTGLVNTGADWWVVDMAGGFYMLEKSNKALLAVFEDNFMAGMATVDVEDLAPVHMPRVDCP